MSNDEYKVNWVYWGESEKSLENTLSKLELKSVPEIVVDCVVDRAIDVVIEGVAIVNGVVENVIEGAEEVIKSTPMYKMGHNDGKKEGVVKTAEKFEDKLKNQAKHFEEQKGILKEDIDDLKALIKAYEKYIEEKEAEFENLSKEKLKELKEIKEKYEKLLNIKKSMGKHNYFIESLREKDE